MILDKLFKQFLLFNVLQLAQRLTTLINLLTLYGTVIHRTVGWFSFMGAN